MSKKTYKVINAVEHDNVRYESGSSMLLSDQAVAGLLTANAVELDVNGPTEADAPVVPTAADERLAAITAAIGQLDPNNLDLWLKDGKPSNDAVALVLGWQISSAERNAAWAVLNP